MPFASPLICVACMVEACTSRRILNRASIKSSRMAIHGLKNIVIEPNLNSNKDFLDNLKKICPDLDGEIFIFRPQTRPSDGFEEALEKHRENWKPQSVLLIIDFDGYIEPDFVPDPWKGYFVDTIQIHAPDGCINKNDVTKLSSYFKKVVNAKKRGVNEAGTDDYDPNKSI